ncbi:MAG TPA: hypothetical protein PKE04_16820, partial [Clostridia bacterium]|nr:hypothetical protein [Clostridia bacterium]
MRPGAAETGNEMTALCGAVRELMAKGAYPECEARIAEAMGKHPHAPQPHNLIGILLEKTGDTRVAMKHFRAACALDPKYLPARRNAERVASFFVHAASAFDETDCFEEQ